MPIVASSNTAAGAINSSATTVSAPTGISAGDLLVVVAISYFNGANITCPDFVEANRFDINFNAGRGTLAVLYKYAVTADETATSYSVSTDQTNSMGPATVMRVTGGPVSGNPFYFSNTGTAFSFVSTSVRSDAFTSVRPSDTLHILSAACFSTEGFSGDVDMNAYQITSSEPNPTWTEINDTHKQVSTGVTNFTQLAVAYATTSATSDVTDAGLTFSEVSNITDSISANYIYLTVQAPVNASGENNFVTAGTTTFDGSGVTNVSASNVFASGNANTLEQAGQADTLTKWTNEAEVSTEWTNESL